MTDALILLVSGSVLALLFWPRVRQNTIWRATITPLASIIGSGFLVLGPILAQSYGAWAPLVMAALCLVAWAFGAAIRANIATIDALPERPKPERALEEMASGALAFAYVISVAYYLNLFGSFGVRLTPIDSPDAARWLTTAVYGVILLVGWTKGFSALERMEQITVSLKLAIIAGMLIGLSLFFAGQTQSGGLIAQPSNLAGWPAVALAFGLIVTVQGFETSRYLSNDYNAKTRIRSMQVSQIVSTLIYMIYTLLLVYSIAPPQGALSETSIIDMMGRVAPVLPALLVAAALAAQFSAAVADTAGSGGLLAELSRHRLTPRMSYALLVTAGLVLTWTANVFQIIAYASRAFAAYYALQSAIAAYAAWTDGKHARATLYAALVVLGAAITLLGRPVE